MTPDTNSMHTRRLIPLLGTACFAGALNTRVMDPFVLALAGEFAASPEHAALVASVPTAVGETPASSLRGDGHG